MEAGEGDSAEGQVKHHTNLYHEKITCNSHNKSSMSECLFVSVCMLTFVTMPYTQKLKNSKASGRVR